MKLASVTVGKTFWQASLIATGRGEVENLDADRFTTRREAEQDGRALAGDYDPEWQKRHPRSVRSFVTKWRVYSVELPNGDTSDEAGAVGVMAGGVSE